jgi:hypothetical protein
MFIELDDSGTRPPDQSSFHKHTAVCRQDIDFE